MWVVKSWVILQFCIILLNEKIFIFIKVIKLVLSTWSRSIKIDAAINNKKGD